MNIKSNILFVVLFLLTINLYSQIDSLENRKIYNWKLNPYDLSIQLEEIDTSLTSFQNYNPLLKNSISYNYLGNMGTAAQSKVYYDRRKYETEFVFTEPYAMYFQLPEDQYYFNTKRPFTVFNYSNAGPKNEAEQTLGVLHTQNITKDFNFGFDYDMISSDGRYQNQETKQNKVTLFSSYRKKGYRIHTNMGLNRVNAQENGGIDSVYYLHDDEYKNRLNIPVKLEDANIQVRNTKLYLAQEYRFGRTVEKITVKEKINEPDDALKPETLRSKGRSKTSVQDSSFNSKDLKINLSRDTLIANNMIDSLQQDSLATNTIMGIQSVEVVDTIRELKFNGFSFSHELIYDKSSREFFDENLTEAFYEDKERYIDTVEIHDKVSQKRFGNKLSFHFRYLDKFSTRISFYDEQMTYKYNIIHDTIIKYIDNIDKRDTIINTELENKLSNGNVSMYLNAVLFNQILFSGYGEYFVYGYKKENSKLDLKFAYKLWSNTEISLEGEYFNKRPNYFYNNFSSNNHMWDNENIWRIEEWDAGFAIRNSKYKLFAKIRYGQISNHVFLDSTANVNQYDGLINIISGELSKRLILGPVKSVTRFVYQQSTDQEALSLPELNLYQSLYFEWLTNFKATGGKLLWQVGVDYRYTSSYMADGYMPTTGLFYRQFSHEQVDYHRFDVFINFTISRLRFFLKYDYLNSALNQTFYFNSPYYPSPEPLLKFGIAWTFYD